MLLVFIFYLLSVLVLSHCGNCKAVRISEQNMTQLRSDSFNNLFPAVLWRPNGKTLYINGTSKRHKFSKKSERSGDSTVTVAGLLGGGRGRLTYRIQNSAAFVQAHFSSPHSSCRLASFTNFRHQDTRVNSTLSEPACRLARVSSTHCTQGTKLCLIQSPLCLNFPHWQPNPEN